MSPTPQEIHGRIRAAWYIGPDGRAAIRWEAPPARA